MAAIGVTGITDEIIVEAAEESRLHGANKSQVMRFALLRLIMPAKDARATVFGESSDLQANKGRVDFKMPEHEVDLVRSKYPDLPISQLARIGLEISRGGQIDEAVTNAMRKRGRPRKER